MDQRVLKTILENHILKLKVSLSELYNGQELETLGGRLLRVFIYRTVELTLWLSLVLWLCRGRVLRVIMELNCGTRSFRR